MNEVKSYQEIEDEIHELQRRIQVLDEQRRVMLKVMTKQQAIYWLSLLLKVEKSPDFIEALKMGIKALVD